MNNGKLLACIISLALLDGCSPLSGPSLINAGSTKTDLQETAVAQKEPAAVKTGAIPQAGKATEKFLVFNPPSVTNRENLAVSGQTLPGSSVVINRQKQEVGEDGAFTAVLQLQPGLNIIPVQVTAPNHRYAGSVPIEYRPDEELPRLDFDLKDQYSYNHIIFKGSTDPGNQVTINHRPISIQENGDFLAEIFLVQGIHVLHLTVTNKDKKTATLQKTVKVIYPVKKPSLIVSMPEEPGFVSEDRIIIQGFTDIYNLVEVYNNYFNTDGQESLSLAAAATVDGKGVFMAEVALNPGPNNLIIRAIDPRGAVTEVTRKIYSKNNVESSFGIPKGNGYGYENPDAGILNEKYNRPYDQVDEEDQ